MSALESVEESCETIPLSVYPLDPRRTSNPLHLPSATTKRAGFSITGRDGAEPEDGGVVNDDFGGEKRLKDGSPKRKVTSLFV